MQTVGNTWDMKSSNAIPKEMVRWAVFELVGDFGENQKLAVGICTEETGIIGIVTAPILDYSLKHKIITTGDGDRYKFVGDEGLDGMGSATFELWKTMHGVKASNVIDITGNYV